MMNFGLSMDTTINVLVVVLLIHQIVGPPVTTKTHDDSSKNVSAHLTEMGIGYSHYLTQVVEVLESDPVFRKKLETADEADIRSGKIAQELDYVSHNVRNRLDELKRDELHRLRLLISKAQQAENDVDPKHLQDPVHVDHTNPHSFEIADLHKLISKVTEDLEEADKMRRKEFKEYEMQKEFEKEQKLKQMDEEHKKEYLHKLEEQKKLHDKHDPVPIHHPGSKQQLKEVWEKQDHMETQEFDPKAFFYMHDLDGNGFWDQDEVKTLFLKELDKMYQAGAPEDDMRERAEDMERMREHVFGEMDVNKDGLISFEEFLQQTKNPEFEKDPGWETVDHQQAYTPEEYAEFEHRRQEEIERLIAEGKLQRLPPPPHGMQPPPAQNQYHQQGYQVPQYQGQQQYQQAQVPQQQAYQGQQYQSNNIPQQQPVPNNIPQLQQPLGNVPQQPAGNAQQPLSNNLPQPQYQAPSGNVNNIPQQQPPNTNNIPQPPSNIPQLQNPPVSNNNPQPPVQNNPPPPPQHSANISP